jgi:hypothetical protein
MLEGAGGIHEEGIVGEGDERAAQRRDGGIGHGAVLGKACRASDRVSEAFRLIN